MTPTMARNLPHFLQERRRRTFLLPQQRKTRDSARRTISMILSNGILQEAKTPIAIKKGVRKRQMTTVLFHRQLPMETPVMIIRRSRSVAKASLRRQLHMRAMPAYNSHLPRGPTHCFIITTPTHLRQWGHQAPPIMLLDFIPIRLLLGMVYHLYNRPLSRRRLGLHRNSRALLALLKLQQVKRYH